MSDDEVIPEPREPKLGINVRPVITDLPPISADPPKPCVHQEFSRACQIRTHLVDLAVSVTPGLSVDPEGRSASCESNVG